MRYWTYDEADDMSARLAAARRPDLSCYVPLGGNLLNESTVVFWADVLARFARGECHDAVTAIERRFEPKWLDERESRFDYEQHLEMPDLLPARASGVAA